MSEFKREDKYLVLKKSDIESVLSDEEKRRLHNICLRISESRQSRGKFDSSYVVVKESEPYADQVWELIKAELEREE